MRTHDHIYSETDTSRRPLREWAEERSPKLAWRYPYQQVLMGALDRVLQGQSHRALLLQPPRHYLSTLLAHFVARWGEDHPGTTVGYFSYNKAAAAYACRRSLSLWQRQDIPMSLWQRVHSGHEMERWEMAGGRGTLIAANSSYNPTGLGYDLAVIDSPFRAPQTAADTSLQLRVWEWFLNVVHPRMNPGGVIVVAGCRMAFGDLAGRILREKWEPEESWERVRLPALGEGQRARDEHNGLYGLPLGERDPLDRSPGQVLCPELISASALEHMRLVHRESHFYALYQQDPAPTEEEWKQAQRDRMDRDYESRQEAA